MHKYAQCVERPGPGQAISFRAQFVAGNVIYRTNDACIFWHGFAATFYVIHVLPAEHADHAKPNTNSALTFLGCLGKRKTVNKIASRDLRTQVYARARLAENNQLDLYTNTHTHTRCPFLSLFRGSCGRTGLICLRWRVPRAQTCATGDNDVLHPPVRMVRSP